MRNSRARVMEHLEACTSSNGYGIWDIEKCKDRSILLFNVKDVANRHWLLALETYLEHKCAPHIKSQSIG